LLLSGFDRPGVFHENNFELMFLLFFSIAVFASTGSLSKVDISMLILIIFLSGSRSGVVSLFAMLCILYVRTFDFKTFLKIFFIGILGVGVIFIFISRLGSNGVEAIDRFVFMQGFILAIGEWGFIDYLTGSEPLTALPTQVCDRLRYYEVLFSAGDPNKCYSVILHSYILRVILDHGIIGLFFVFISIAKLLEWSELPKRSVFAVMSILFLNALSVSAFNSVFAILGLIILLTSPYPNKSLKEQVK